MPLCDWRCSVCGKTREEFVPLAEIGTRHPADESYPCECGGIQTYEFTRNRHPALDFPLHNAAERYEQDLAAQEQEEQRYDLVDRYEADQECKRGERRIAREGAKIFV